MNITRIQRISNNYLPHRLFTLASKIKICALRSTLISKLINLIFYGTYEGNLGKQLTQFKTAIVLSRYCSSLKLC